MLLIWVPVNEEELKTLLVFLTSAAIAVAACSSSSVSTSPSPAKCQVSVTAPQASLDPAGGPAAVTVATQAECAWTAASDVGWITGFSPASGQGPAEVRFQVAANTTPTMRQGRITLNETVAQVTQSGQSAPACQIDLFPRAQLVDANAGIGTVEVTAPGGCGWTATSNASWLTITLGASGSGNGGVRFSVAANTGVARLATLTIAGQTSTITQAAPGTPQCSYTIQPESASMPLAGGTTQVGVQTSTSCSWTAASNVAWLNVAGVGVGSGNGNVTINVSPNTGAARNGTVAIAGRTFTVNQAGCTLSINSASQSLPATAGNGSAVAVSAPGGCGWTATAGASWITITGGASGTGNGNVTFSVSANTGSTRVSTIVVGTQTHTVTQAGSCAVTIAPASQTVPAAAGAATSVTVTAASGCNWTATPSQSWITISSGASGSGNGAVAFGVTANTGPSRNATITIAGQVHTVTQASGCTYSISPTSHALDEDGQTAPAITVTTAAGCTWTATANDSWITIQNGESGTGSGSVTYKVTKNNGSPRTGTLTIAGRTFTVVQDDH